jgi:hypothetical protein
MNILIFSALLAIVVGLARVMRRIDELSGKIDYAVDETNIEASATRLYLGRLSGNDPGLIEQRQIDSGTF